MDTWQREQANGSPRLSDHRLRGIIEVSPTGISLSDAAGHLEMVNAAYCAMFGYTAKELIGQLFTIVVFEHMRDRAVKAYLELLTSGLSEEAQVDFRRKDGTAVTALSSGASIVGDDGKLHRVSFVMDITERERTAVALRASEARLRAQYQGLPLPTLTWQRQGDDFVLIDCNRAAEQISEGRIRSLLGSTASAMYADTPVLLASFERCWAEQRADEFEMRYRFRTTDVEKDVVMSHVYIAPDMVLQYTADVSARRQAEAAVHRHLSELTALRAIDISITGSSDLTRTLDVVLTQVLAQLGVDAATVLLLNPESRVLECVASMGFRGAAGTLGSLPLGEGHAGRAALERRRVSVPDLRAAPLVRRELVAAEGFMSYYAVPLIAKGAVQGVLEVFHRTLLAPAPHWLQFLDTLAGQAAIAIENMTLFAGLQQSNLELSLAYDTTIEGWSRALDLRDKETEGHSRRVTTLTLTLARQMGMAKADLVQVRRGALLHDIGKMGIPDHILLKPGPLTEAEWVVMRRHPTYAFELLAPITHLRHALDIPYCHHERWDGSGYPRGLKGEAIPLAARIFAVADVWDALRSDRPYRAGWPDNRVRAHIHGQAGTHFEPRVVDAFMALTGDGLPDFVCSGTDLESPSAGSW